MALHSCASHAMCGLQTQLSGTSTVKNMWIDQRRCLFSVIRLSFAIPSPASNHVPFAWVIQRWQPVSRCVNLQHNRNDSNMYTNTFRKWSRRQFVSICSVRLHSIQIRTFFTILKTYTTSNLQRQQRDSNQNSTHKALVSQWRGFNICL